MNTDNQNIFSNESTSSLISDITTESLAIILLPMISIKRFQTKLYWLDIGRALHSAYEGSQNGLQIWIEASRKAYDKSGLPHFINVSIETSCTKLYLGFTRGLITVKTLAWYARCDSPKLYDDWLNFGPHSTAQETINEMLTKIDGEDLSEAVPFIVKVFNHMFWLDLCYNPSYDKKRWYEFKHRKWIVISESKSFASGTWYYYNGNKWVKDSDRKYLDILLLGSFAAYFDKMRVDIARESCETTNCELKYENNKKIESISYLLDNLVNFKHDVINGASVYFTQDNFESKLDSNTNTVGMKDAVLEIVGNDTIIREAKPEDFISLSTDILYQQPKTTSDQPNDIQALWDKMVPDPKLRAYFMKFMSSNIETL